MAYDRRWGEASFTQPARRRINYQVEIGRVHLPNSADRDFAVLDPDRARTLRAWVDTLIPTRGERPKAGDIGAAEYVDTTAFRAPPIRALLLDALEAVNQISVERHGGPFVDIGAEDRAAILRYVEEMDESGAFAMVRDLTYEAYYTHRRVLDLLERETGWRYETTFSGSEMEPFDERLVARMRTSPPTWREA
jgi:Gluconate 2-dehydrogenase subunit 3